LTVDWKALAVTDSLVATDFNLAANIGCYVTTKFTFGFVGTFDVITKSN
jgi:hypothetical protein